MLTRQIYKSVHDKLILSCTIALIFSALILTANADAVLVCGFEKGKSSVKARLNCRIDFIDNTTERSIPEGSRCLKVTMGGINEQKGAAVIISIPKDKIPASATAISFWLKGNDKNKFGPVIMFGDWCWMGKRYEKKAQIEVSDPEWTKYEFQISDFVPALARTPTIGCNINLYNELYITLGEAVDYPESIVFYIDSIDIK